MKPFYVDVSIYKDEEERHKIEKEIFDIAVANGAEIYEARDWWTSKATITTSANWRYFGVDDTGRTFFSNRTNYYGKAVQLTIEQLREKYLMKKEQDDVRTWGCFQQVANVIGEEAAVRELSLITDEMRLWSDYVKRNRLFENFIWYLTPQGRSFWDDIDKGNVPDPYKTIVKQPQNQRKDESNTNTPPEQENVSEVDTVSENAVKNTVTGGSSPSYYRKTLTLPCADDRTQYVEVHLEAGDIIQAWGLDFDGGNVIKSQLRGSGKDGVDDKYALDKIIWFALRQQMNLGIITHKEFWEKAKAVGLSKDV